MAKQKQSPAYKKGYLDGYMNGRREASDIVKMDLIGVYGAMCLYFIETRHWTTDYCMSAMKGIQDKWRQVIETDHNMIAEVDEKLGFDIEQFVCGIEE